MKNEMTVKERILNSFTGKEVDRMPWCPFLAYYWDKLPQETKDKGQFDYMVNVIGSDPLIRGSHTLAKAVFNNCEVKTWVDGKKKYEEFQTKFGNLRLGYSYSDDADSWFLTEHPVTQEEDFKVLQYLYENVTFEENLKQFEEDYAKMGDNGLYIPVIGTKLKTSFQSLVEHWCGTVDLTYALYDFPELVEECLETMIEKDRENVEISVKSSAEALLFYEDSSTTNISPEQFEKYTKPEIDMWGDILHRENKLLVHHACGHLRNLLPLISKSNIDVLESLSPPPTGDVELFLARALLDDRIAIMGGIEPVHLLNLSLPELEAYVKEIISCMKGTRYVLANSDSCPQGVAEEKLKLISEIAKQYG